MQRPAALVALELSKTTVSRSSCSARIQAYPGIQFWRLGLSSSLTNTVYLYRLRLRVHIERYKIPPLARSPLMVEPHRLKIGTVLGRLHNIPISASWVCCFPQREHCPRYHHREIPKPVIGRLNKRTTWNLRGAASDCSNECIMRVIVFRLGRWRLTEQEEIGWCPRETHWAFLAIDQRENSRTYSSKCQGHDERKVRSEHHQKVPRCILCDGIQYPRDPESGHLRCCCQEHDQRECENF